jgi:non-ribosomal peptide synthetase component F/acyl carrier protein
MPAQALQKANIQDIYPLTPLQQGMYFHFLRGQLQTYYCQMSYRVTGNVDERLVKEAFTNLFHFHPVLKTVCVSQSGKLMGVVLNEVQVEMNCFDLSGHEKTDEALTLFKERDRDRSFDIEKELLMRLLLVRLGDGCYEFIWSHHHLIMDGWSLGILINDFYTLYRQLQQRQTPALKPVVYTTFLQWLERQDLSAARAYWLNYLSQYDEPASLREVNSLPFREGRLRTVLDWTVTRGLMDLAAVERVTLNTVVQALWGVVLSRYMDRPDVVFGTVVSGRPTAIADVEHIVGLFINTLPMRVRYDANTTFHQLLQQVRKNVMESESYQYYPLVEIQTESPLKDQLFDHLLVFENFPVTEQLTDGLRPESNAFLIQRVEAMERTHYDLNLLVSCRQDELSIEYKYNSNRYPDTFIQRINGKIIQLAKQAMDHPESPIVQLELADAGYSVSTVTSDGEDRQAGSAVPDLFRRHAEAFPDEIALEESDRAYTYSYLSQQVIQLSRLLHRKRPLLSVVPVLARIEVDTVIALLSILHSGNAFVIIDPSWPGERIRYVLEDINPSLVITNSDYSNMIPSGYEIFIAGHQKYSPEFNDHSFGAICMNDTAFVSYMSLGGGDIAGLAWDHYTLSRRLPEPIRGNHFAGAVYSVLAWTLGAAPSMLVNGQREYVLSHDKRVQGIGMEGEIAINGATLPLGYLNRPQLTKEKLVHDVILNTTFFLTGKRGRQTEDGKIEQLLSLGEIESAARAFPGIEQAVCLRSLNGPGGTSFSLYYTAGGFISTKEINGFLRQRLPANMMPAQCLQLDEMPLTVYGVPDRRKISAIVAMDNRPVTVPRDEVEIKLRSLWSAILEREEEGIDINTDFFYYGGHSLKAIRLNSMIQKHFNIKLSLDQFFSSPTVEGLAKQIKAIRTTIRI